MRLLLQPNGQRLGDHLQAELRAPNWDRFRAAIAFAKQAGVAHVAPDLTAFSRRAAVAMVVGKDLNGTSYEAIRDLHAALSSTSELWLFHNPAPTRPTFHPKIYLFADARRALLTIGSGNLTRGGLFTNYEGSVTLDLDLSDPIDAALLKQVELELDGWGPKSAGKTSLRVTASTLATLLANGELLPEAFTRSVDEDPTAAPGAPGAKPKPRSSFTAVGVPAAPSVPRGPKLPVPAKPALKATPGASTPTAAAPVVAAAHVGYVMTLQPTDVGVGMKTVGASPRSPEVFIPLAARDFDPAFWQWPTGFTPDRTNPGKMDRTGVKIFLNGNVVSLNMMTWPAKSDFRLRSQELRKAGAVGDILRMEVAKAPGYDYFVSIVPKGTPQHAANLALCTNAVRNSKKQWGYF